MIFILEAVSRIHQVRSERHTRDWIASRYLYRYLSLRHPKRRKNLKNRKKEGFHIPMNICCSYKLLGLSGFIDQLPGAMDLVRNKVGSEGLSSKSMPSTSEQFLGISLAVYRGSPETMLLGMGGLSSQAEEKFKLRQISSTVDWLLLGARGFRVTEGLKQEMRHSGDGELSSSSSSDKSISLKSISLKSIPILCGRSSPVLWHSEALPSRLSGTSSFSGVLVLILSFMSFRLLQIWSVMSWLFILSTIELSESVVSKKDCVGQVALELESFIVSGLEEVER